MSNTAIDTRFFANNKKKKDTRFHLFISLYKGNGLNFILSILFFIVKFSPVWIIPYITAKIIDVVSNPLSHSLHELWIYGIIVAISLLINIPFHILHISYFSKALRKVEADIRSALVRKLQILSFLFHKDLQSGKVQSKILRDVESIEFLSRQIMMTILPAIVNIIVAVFITVRQSTVVAIFFFVSVPISVLLVYVFRDRMSTTNKRFRKEIEEMSSKVSEMITMVPITRAHGLESEEIQKLDIQLEKVKWQGYKFDMFTAVFGSISWVLFQTFQVICLFFTAILAFRGLITIGDVVMYQNYFGMLIGQISAIVGIYPQMIKGLESITSISEILNAQEVEENEGKLKIKNVEGRFSFNNVCFNYPTSDENVLNNLNFYVRAGECVAFVGESGAGKSTLLNMIIGFLEPSEGSIFIDGMDMSTIDKVEYRRNISVVPQNPVLFSGSIRDNITYGLNNVDDERLAAIVEAANVKEFVSKLPDGLETMIGERGDKLSGGQKQRIAIARALIRDPKIIILDEATSALDNISEMYVQQALKRLISNRTTFIVAHRLSTIKHADRIIVIKNGKIVESGTYDELIEQKGEFYVLNNINSY